MLRILKDGVGGEVRQGIREKKKSKGMELKYFVRIFLGLEFKNASHFSIKHLLKLLTLALLY